MKEILLTEILPHHIKLTTSGKVILGKMLK